MHNIAAIILITIVLIAGAIATDTQCKVMRPSSNTIVVACSAGRLEAQR